MKHLMEEVFQVLYDRDSEMLGTIIKEYGYFDETPQKKEYDFEEFMEFVEKIAKEQVCGEKAKTKLIIQQIVTEQYRHRDLRASIKVKIASNEVTKQQAKFEEARRHIALQSNNQNTFMKKADYKVQQLQALAQDDKVVISAEQISDTKTTIEAIPTQIISYNTEVQVDSINIPDTEIATPVINCEEQSNG